MVVNVTFGPGMSFATVNIPIVNDTLYENDEVFYGNLRLPAGVVNGVQFDPMRANVTIFDDDCELLYCIHSHCNEPDCSITMHLLLATYTKDSVLSPVAFIIIGPIGAKLCTACRNFFFFLLAHTICQSISQTAGASDSYVISGIFVAFFVSMVYRFGLVLRKLNGNFNSHHIYTYNSESLDYVPRQHS